MPSSNDLWSISLSIFLPRGVASTHNLHCIVEGFRLKVAGKTLLSTCYSPLAACYLLPAVCCWQLPDLLPATCYLGRFCAALANNSMCMLSATCAFPAVICYLLLATYLLLCQLLSGTCYSPLAACYFVPAFSCASGMDATNPRSGPDPSPADRQAQKQAVSRMQ